MKRNLILGLMTLGAASMLCGFDSAETVDGVMQKMQEASAAATGVAMDMVMDVDVDVNIGDGETTSTLAIAMGGDFDLAATTKPFAMSMDGKMTLSALGSGQEMEMKMYGVTNEAGALETYVYVADSATGEAEWVYDVEDSINMNELMESSETLAMDAAALAEWGLVFELAPEAVDVNGTECYEVKTTIDAETINTLLTKTAELAGEDLAGEEELATVLALLDGLKLNLSYCVDTATYLPVSMHMDMNGTDLSTANALVQSMMAMDESTAGTTVEIVLNNVSVDVATAYGEVEAITVPQEALDAVASGEAASVSEIVDEVA